MKRTSSSKAIAGVAMIAAISAVALAGNLKDGPVTFTGGTFTLKITTRSTHQGTDPIPRAPAFDSIDIQAFTTSSSHKKTIGGHPFIDNYFISGYDETDFAGRFEVDGSAGCTIDVPDWHAPQCWNPAEVHAQADWTVMPDSIHPDMNQFQADIGDNSVWAGGICDSGDQDGFAAHIETVSDATVCTAEMVNTEGCPVALVTDIRLGGWAVLDENGDFVWDENGSIVWDTEPALACRFTSSVAPDGDNVVYTYRIDNNTDFGYDFTVPQVKTSGYPSGWSGHVDAHDYVSITNTDTVQEDVHSQRAQADYTYSGTYPFHFANPVAIYIPASLRGYHGTNSITSITTNTLTHTNTVHFMLAGAPAEGAVVMCSNGSTLRRVGRINSALVVSTDYTIDDPEYIAGENTYCVKTGAECNHYICDGASVSNL